MPAVPNSPPAGLSAASRPAAATWRCNRAAVVLQAVLILVAGWFVYSPALQGDWLWDDDREVTQNPLLRDAGGLARIWGEASSSDYFPLKSTVQWIEWHLWQDRPTGYHIVSVGLHLLSALLLWRLLQKLGIRLAWVGGLLFAIHPLAVESVAWIAEQKNTLSLPPLLLAMCAYLDFDDRHRGRDLVRAAGWFLAAMLCKTSVVMFPLIILLHAGWKRGTIGRRDLAASAPFFAISFGLGLVTLWFQHHHAIGDWTIPVGGPSVRLARAGLALSFYFLKCLVPVGLLPLYPRWAVDPPGLVQFVPWLLWAGTGFWLWRRQGEAWARAGWFGLGSFAVNLAPVLGFVAMAYMRYSWVADHFAYLSLVSLAGLAAAGTSAIYPRLTGAGRPLGLAAAGGIGLALVLTSHGYARVFRNEEALWSYTLSHNPQAWAAHYNLGTALARAGKWEDARGRFDEALGLKPDFADAQNNLAVALLHLGREQEAFAHVQQALVLRPDYPDAQVNLGNILARMGRLDEAAAHYARALQNDPGFTAADVNWGNALARAGRVAEAIDHYQRALRGAPRSAVAHFDFGATLAEHGRLAEALDHYAQAAGIEPGNAEYHNALGTVLAQLARADEALAHLDQALRINPEYAEAHCNRGNVLVQLDRISEAISEYERALQLDPRLTEAAHNLALARRHAAP